MGWRGGLRDAGRHERAALMPRWKEGTPEVVIKLHEWQQGATHFRARLFHLMQHADAINLSRLAVGFPDEVDVFKRWNASANEETFFNQYFEPEPEPKDSWNG